MANHERTTLEERLTLLKRRVRRGQAGWAATAAAFGAILLLSAFRGQDPPQVLRVRGIVIEDADSKPRVLIGAPIPAIPERTRKDPATGIVVLDPSGVDRVQLGRVGDPQMGGVVQPRIAQGHGLMVCDPKGEERGGFGYLENGQVGWGLDYAGQEAIVAAVIPERGMAGIIINADVKDGNPTRAMLITTPEGSGLRLSDGSGAERAVFEVGGLGAPALKLFDAKGEVVRDALQQD